MDNQIIERIVVKVSSNIYSGDPRSISWKNLSEDQLLHELVSCILGSQMHFETAVACSKRLQELRLLKPGNYKRILFELSKKDSNGKGLSCRYPKMKAKYVSKTISSIYHENKTSLKELLRSSKDDYEARDKLVMICLGIGYKQASLFLRNINFSENLAILDSHVLKYMVLQEICTEEEIVKVSSNYLKLENNFLSYAYLLNQSLNNLDIAIWTVMRVISKENKWQLLH